MDESEKKIEALREKRTAAVIVLNEIVEEKKFHQAKADRLRKKAREQAQKIRDLSAAIGKVKDGTPQGKVTDHAIVRYLQRYQGLDVEKIANEILEHPDAKFSNHGTVTTIFEDKQQPADDDVRKMLKIGRMKKVI